MSLSNCSLPILGFAAFSGTGKTTLLEALLPKLVETGIRVAMVKHAHHEFDVDKPGKDSYRLRKAGASQMLISSRFRHALMTETPDFEPSLNQILSRLDQSAADLVLVEGFKRENFPKIELHREAVGKPWLYPEDSNIIAIASDSTPDSQLPLLNINDIDSITAFIQRWMQGHLAHTATCDTLAPAMLSVEQGRSKILDQIIPKSKSKQVELKDAFGRVLAEDVKSPVNVPAQTNSAMDGYAIRSDDLDAQDYEVLAEVMAGYSYNIPLEKGQAIKVMTGAPVPKNADTVVMREQAVLSNGRVSMDTGKGAIKPGQNVRQAGEDLREGDVVFSAGQKINSAELGMLASMGLSEVRVKSPVKVAIFSTGDEVQQPGEALRENCIYDANRYTLFGMLTKLGCLVIDLGIIDDTETALENALSEASTVADMVISSGGVSVGDADYIKTVLERLGEINFWRINMRPGRPLAFGKLGDTPFFGLPGNPVAVMVSFLQFVEPAIRKLQGESNWQPLTLEAVATERMRSRIGRTEYTRGVFSKKPNGLLEVRTTGSQGSGILRSMSEANCLIEIVPEQEEANIGDRVQIIPLSV
ncbi:bifunctional molybdopterin-guanine dinucleotide biosynthesis adaptor protein MobB/molybdopterin molybdotransferase MoeA [Parasalinivibrio latis]|uniref:bifunctional molybdopterin-guanine dinucleotide biosynthesis adaptor protein MobB/molybdopterin molybdotransferase MoeA n=1 Tax=Parasalinivibrio latis TaxID=2952610 RepID=UPI0030E02ACB